MTPEAATIRDLRELVNILEGLRGSMLLSLSLKNGHPGHEYVDPLEPLEDTTEWQRISQEVLVRLLRARQVAFSVQQLLDRDLPDKGLGYQALVLIDDLMRDWQPALLPGPIEGDGLAVFGTLNERLEQLAARLRHAPALLDAIATGPAQTPTGCFHNSEFTFVLWHGQEFHFKKGQQAHVVERLWGEWAAAEYRDGVGVSQEALNECAGSGAGAFEVRKVFRSSNVAHPAWGTMIGSPQKGVFALYGPQGAEETE